MTLQMGLTGSAILFVGLHFLLSHPLRGPLVRSVGEGAFRGIYSLLALITFGAMLYYYHAIGRETPMWQVGELGWALCTLAMWFAAILFVGSFMKNPALVGAAGPRGGPTGVMRITRHPMMWSFAIWAAVHMTVVGTMKSLVLDIPILVLALGGALGQDAKKARLMGENWHDWTAETAFIPFTRGFAFPGIIAFAGGTLLFILATWAHPVPAGFWRWIT